MITILQTRNRQLALRLALTLLIFTLLATTLSLLVRKVQSQRQLVALHTKILTNLPLMQRETTSLQQQVTAFRQALPAELTTRSAELMLYSRLDEIKSTLQPSEMTVTAPESKDGLQTIGFNLKVPFARYNQLVNAMGQLQTRLIPFADFNELSMSPTTTEGSIVVNGSVVLPPLTGVKP